ncbi:DNA-directed RNA polymerase I core subunit rpa12 [Zalaria obscura]|uniref:DNA-directed RNA polymerase I core subunit rpa12 n=1 Tax=Zalaria obscura TaxID=2024903 RepID=A0ACC3SH10_9PEZI
MRRAEPLAGRGRHKPMRGAPARGFPGGPAIPGRSPKLPSLARHTADPSFTRALHFFRSRCTRPSRNMSAIGSLVFCSDCGNLLDRASGAQRTTLECDVCGAKCKDTSSKVIVTHSKPDAFPSSLRAKRSEVQTLTEEDIQVDATIRQTCEKCGREEVRYYTQQLRSADEGSTVFYTCDCGHKWNTNN